jgi:ABC-type phosphate/phosphonate transport system substrate-binding protein
MLALLLNLSDNQLKQSQINTVVVQQEKMDRVGFEPTTSAAAFLVALYLLSKGMQL